MAKSHIPDPLERRHLLEKQLDPAQARKVADAYLEAGRTVEALAFLAGADASDELDQIAERAIEDGDYFLYKAARAARGEEVSNEAWRRLASAAEAAGKLRYAQTARRQVDREEG